MIELSEKVIAIWFISLDDESDFIAALEQEAENYFKLTFRIRYYKVEGHPFSDWDEKRWYQGDFHGTKERALAEARRGVNALAHDCGSEVDEIMASSPEEYLEILKTRPYVHIKELTKEERKELEKEEDEWPKEI